MLLQTEMHLVLLVSSKKEDKDFNYLVVIILHNDKNIDFHKKISISSPKNSLLKVLSEKRRRGRHGNKKYDEGVGCGRTNQQLDLYIRVCALVMHYFTRSTSLKCTPVKFRVTLIHQNKLNV